MPQSPTIAELREQLAQAGVPTTSRQRRDELTELVAAIPADDNEGEHPEFAGPELAEEPAPLTVDGTPVEVFTAALTAAGMTRTRVDQVAAFLGAGRPTVPGAISQDSLTRREGASDNTMTSIPTLRAVMSPHATRETRQAAVLQMLGEAGLLGTTIPAYPHEPRGRGRSRSPHPLTRDEVTILTLVSQGYSDAEVAEATYRNPATVKSHVGYIRMHMGLHSRMECVLVAVREGYIPIPA